MMPEIKRKEDDWDSTDPYQSMLNSSKILSASDALLKTKETHLKNIERFIIDAIKCGETSVQILPKDHFISDENRQILKDAGYHVSSKETMAGDEIKISWE